MSTKFFAFAQRLDVGLWVESLVLSVTVDGIRSHVPVVELFEDLVEHEVEDVPLLAVLVSDSLRVVDVGEH